MPAAASTASPGQHPGQVLPVVRSGVQLAGRAGALRGMGGRIGHRRRGRAHPGQRRLGRGRAQWRRAHVGQRDPGLRDRPVRPAHRRGHPDHRPGLGGAVELLVVVAPSVTQLGYPDRDQHLVPVQRGGEVVDEELRGRDLPPAVRAGGHQHAVQGQGHCRQVAGRVGVGQRAAERAAVPDLRVGDRAGRRGQQRGVLAHQRVVHHLVVGGGRADEQRVAGVRDTTHVLDPAAVHQHRRCRKPHPQQRQQGLPAGDDLGLVAGLDQRGHRAVHR